MTFVDVVVRHITHVRR